MCNYKKAVQECIKHDLLPVDFDPCVLVTVKDNLKYGCCQSCFDDMDYGEEIAFYYYNEDIEIYVIGVCCLHSSAIKICIDKYKERNKC